jgi:large subunit ribosomal protein L30
MAKIKVTLRRGMAGKIKKNKKIVAALGLKKIGDERIFENNSAIAGMIKKVSYLLTVEEI